MCQLGSHGAKGRNDMCAISDFYTFLCSEARGLLIGKGRSIRRSPSIAHIS